MMEYFEIFDLPPKLDLDPEQLQRRFHELSREHHPDFHTTQSVETRQRSLRTTALLNDAYRTLRDPARRVEYLIESNGLKIDGSKVPQALLAEVFEINEELERLRLTRNQGAPDEAVRRSLTEFHRMLAEKRRGFEVELRDAANVWDELVDTGADEAHRMKQLSVLADIVARSAYLRNLEREIASEVSG